MKTINFAIDLGTTNSLVAHFTGVNVEVFKNPIGLKETLPSCVAFRGDRVIVGEKAREWLLKDSLNVFSSFKRKMGTDENYFAPSRNISISPLELSSFVLKELKNFIHSGEIPESVVITIPASFDTVQSNATKQSGYNAGFKEVTLLQEPIAASLAFFNKYNSTEKAEGKWLVYDLGGGTFDIALVGVNESELRVLDHQGDNYLGGIDFDRSLVMNVIVPKLMQQTGNLQLLEKIDTKNSNYEKLYHILLLKAEEAKKELSSQLTSEIEFIYASEEGNEEDIYLIITREDLKSVIENSIESTLSMLEAILERNQLSSADIEEIIMIGGSTYIPYIRETISERTGIKVNTQADPTTAVVVGAAYFAGNKPLSKAITSDTRSDDVNRISILTGYSASTKDAEEYITASVSNFKEGLFYRILRSDGGFDSGLKKLNQKFGEFVLLMPNRVNSFQIKIYDKDNNPVDVEVDIINIAQGLFSLYGQPLPEDICIEVDDLNNNSTKCEVIFARKSILPLSKTIYKELSRTIRKYSDDSLIINLLEGDANQYPSTNKVIGVIEIKADMLMNDLVKGSDVEIKIEMSESRDLSVNTHLGISDQQFKGIFNPTMRYVNIAKLKDEIQELRRELELDLNKAVRKEEFEYAAEIQTKLESANSLYNQVRALKEDSFTDEKYQLDEAKRKLARQIYTKGSINSRVLKIKETYYEEIELLNSWLFYFEDIPEKYQNDINKLKEDGIQAMRSNSYITVESHAKKASKLLQNIILYTPTLLFTYFKIFAELPQESYTDFNKAKKEIERGEKAMDRQHNDELRAVLISLHNLTINSEIIETKIKGTGLG